VGGSPDGPWIIFAHGNRREGQAHPLYQRLTGNIRAEATVLALDLRGFGQSSADGLETAAAVWDRSGDIEAAVVYLKSHYQATDEQIILMGHSLGAAQALKAAQRRPYRLAIPIGLGEGSYVFFLGLIGTGMEEAIAFTWLSFGLMLTHSLMGGVLFALRDASLSELRAKVAQIRKEG
jgi:pimeloyl-ACP methyl ester carboxylesterase